jgi:hypothetical protein
MTIQTIKQQIVPILKRQGVIKAAIFGSFATGKAKKNSDIDILVKFKKNITLLDLSTLKIKLEEKTERKVDLLTYNSINPRLKDIILKEQKQIYEKRS